MKHNLQNTINARLFILGFFFAFSSSIFAQAPPNDSVADATLVTDINFTDPSVNVNQAALILQGTDCTIPDSNPSSPFSAVVYKFTAGSSGDVTVTLGSPSGTSTIIFYSTADVNATLGSELTIITACGTRTSITNACTAGQSYYVSVVNTGGASDIIFSGNAALPVELISFSATSSSSINGEPVIVLNWETATEVNNYGFEIERKDAVTDSEWKTLGFVEGHGNSNSIKNYEFIDQNPPSSSLKYRLKQMDTDGQHDYFGRIIEVNNSSTDKAELSPTEFSLFQNYPNPFNPSTKIKYGIPEAGNVRLEVFNSIGERVTLLTNSKKEPGYYYVNWDAQSLSSGIYLIRLSFEGINTNKTFVKVSKATLLK